MLTSSNPILVVREVGHRYRITKTGSSRGFARKRNVRFVEALKSVSFVASRGEAIGVLGRNGSGKSTLMSIMSGNISPEKGQVLVSQEPTLLSVSAALQSNLTGMQNAELGLLATGLKQKAARKLAVEVVEWADLGEAATRPLKTYSSGMKARLKFAISTTVPTEILLIDEALATGDAAFAEKAKGRMDLFLQNSGAFFLVSHSAATVKKHCRRALWIEGGVVVADGPVREVSKIYERWNKFRAMGENEEASRLVAESIENYVAPEIVLDSEAADMLN